MTQNVTTLPFLRGGEVVVLLAAVSFWCFAGVEGLLHTEPSRSNGRYPQLECARLLGVRHAACGCSPGWTLRRFNK